VDPRLRAIFHASDELELHVAGGVVHQPAVFFIPLPGIADIAIDRGLQAAVQGDAGIGWDTPLALRLEVQGFVHYYQNLVFVYTLLLRESFELICDAIDCGGRELQERIDGFSYGAEVFVKRPLGERVTGWLSYTLAWSSVEDVAGVPYTPTWDVRHVGNAVVAWALGAGFSVGARAHVRSGKLHGEFLRDDQLQLRHDERRLPWFGRIDAMTAYQWSTSWGQMRVSLEWFNVTLAREPVEIVCTGEPRSCRTVYLPAIFFPNLGVRGEI
jgi:hypothetical protein